MKKLFTFAAALALTISAYANRECLQRVSNDELLAELSYRLSSSAPAPIEGDVGLAATCTNWTLKLNSTNYATGVEKNISIDLSSSDACSRLAKLINTKLGSQRLNRSVAIASCTNWTLSRVLVSQNGDMKALANKDLSSSDACQTEANRLNSLW